MYEGDYISSFGRRLASSNGQERYVIRQEDVFCNVSAPHCLTCSHKYILHFRIDYWRAIPYWPTERWWGQVSSHLFLCPQVLAIHTKLLISGWSNDFGGSLISLIRSYLHTCRASRNKKFAFKYGNIWREIKRKWSLTWIRGHVLFFRHDSNSRLTWLRALLFLTTHEHCTNACMYSICNLRMWRRICEILVANVAKWIMIRQGSRLPEWDAFVPKIQF